MSFNIIAGIRMLLRAHKPFKTYSGSKKDIVHKIIRSCFNNTYFQVSSGHFLDFYARDFGMCVESLLELGYEKEVHQTIHWAFNSYTSNITPTITPKGKPIEYFHSFSSDSLPFMLHTLHVANCNDLVKKKKVFLETCIQKYVDEMVDEKTHLVRDTQFNSIKDHYKRKSSCYDTCMVGWSVLLAKKLGLYHPLQDVDYATILQKTYWKGSYFVDDLSKDTVVSADANIFPYYCGLITDKTFFTKSYKTIKALGLDTPFPIKYTAIRQRKKELRIPSFFAPNYEGTSVWIHLGLCFITVVKQYKPLDAKKYLKQYSKILLRHRNFLEVYDENAKPYQSFFYKSDESMLWVSIYEHLLVSLTQKK